MAGRAASSNRHDTLGDRIAAAFVAALFGVPLIGLWWLWLNYAVAGIDTPIPVAAALYALGGFTLFGFVFPNVLPTLFGGLCRALGYVATWWR